MAIRKSKDFNPTNCAVTYCLNIIGGKWKPVIIHLIRSGVCRYSQLYTKIPEVSRQTLTNHLKELVEDGILDRLVFAEIPPKVEYMITELGESLFPIIDAMKSWGHIQMDKKTNKV